MFEEDWKRQAGPSAKAVVIMIVLIVLWLIVF